MNNLEETYQHPAITCKHQFNVADFETFAIELSNRLHLNIEIHYDSSALLQNKTISIDGVTQKGILTETYHSYIPESVCELALKEVKLIIYEDFIEIYIRMTLDYFHLLELNQEKQLNTIEFFKSIFNHLKALEIDQVHFCVFNEFKISENSNYCWRNVKSAILNCKNNFVIDLQSLNL
jgi:hypothetical protein